MKNKLLYIWFGVLFLSLMIGCGSEESSGKEDSSETDSVSNLETEEAIELSFNNWFASTYHWVENVYEPWEETVTNETDGKLKIDFNHGGVIGSADSHYDDLNGEVYDMAVGNPSYYPDTDLFKLTLVQLPFAVTEPVKGANVLNKYMELHGENVWGDKIVSSMGFVSEPYLLFSTEPINSVDDLKGMKVRISDDTWKPTVEEWGATPIFMAGADIYQALDRGTLDAVLYGATGGISLKLPEIAPYILKENMFSFVMTPVITRSALDSFPEDLKSQFENELYPGLTSSFTQYYEGIADEMWDNLESEVEGRGEITTLPPEEREKLLKTAQPSWDEWVKLANQKGYDGDKMMEDFKSILEEEGFELPF